MAKSFYSCSGLCSGRAGILWNCTLWPIVLLYISTRAYFIPCLRIYLERCFSYLYAILCSCCYKPFEDDFFGEKALGDTDSKTAAQMAETCDWVRAGEIVKKDGKPQLFEGKIEPADLCQVIMIFKIQCRVNIRADWNFHLSERSFCERENGVPGSTRRLLACRSICLRR